MRTDHTAPPRSANRFGTAAPIFPVNSMQASIEYYLKALGFKVNWQVEGFASVSRDGCCLFLCEKDQGHPGTWTWIGVSDAAALESEYRRTGGRIRHPATNYPLGLRSAGGRSRRKRSGLRFGSEER